MIYTRLSRTGEIESVKAHGGGDVAEVYGGIGEFDPIFYKGRTITGTPPLSFKALGKPLSDYLISGNTLQNGTPTPQAPVDVVGCGVRTGNLFDENNAGYGEWVNSNGGIETKVSYAAFQDYDVGDAVTFVAKYHGVKPYSQSIAFYDSNGDFISRVHSPTPSASGDIFNVPIGAIKATYQVAVAPNTETINPEKLKQFKIMLNAGSTALPYEPYGYKLPLTVNGTKYPIFLGQVETTRRLKKLVLTGEENITYNTVDRNRLILQSVYTLPTTGTTTATNIICTHLETLGSGVATSTQQGIAMRSNGSDVIFGVAFATIGATADDGNTVINAKFKQFLADQYAAGTPVTIWYVLANPEAGIVNEPLHKIDDYADTITMAQAGETIQTTAGTNTLSVGTTVQPSVSITGNIKEVLV